MPTYWDDTTRMENSFSFIFANANWADIRLLTTLLAEEEDGNIALTKKFIRVFLYNIMENREQTFCEPNRKG